MPNSATYEVAASYAQKAIELMLRSRIAPTPAAYEVWYLYVSETRPDLRQTVQEHLEKGNPLTNELTNTLYQQVCGHENAARALEQASSGLGSEIARIAHYLEQAGQETNAYGNVLEGVAAMMEARSDDTTVLPKLVSKVVQATNEMERKTRSLEHELDLSAREVRKLQGDLETTKREAVTDGLTGLANRRRMDEVLQETIRAAAETGDPFSVIIGDIDDFRSFNERWGHLTGDQVLRLVALCVKDNIKGRDTAVRYDGQQFAVIFPQTKLIGAKAAANHIRQAVERKKIVKKSTGDYLGRMTMSFGVAEYRPSEKLGELLQRGEEAMRAAKAAGRNSVADEVEAQQFVSGSAAA